ITASSGLPNAVPRRAFTSMKATRFPCRAIRSISLCPTRNRCARTCQPRDNRYWIACSSPASPRLWRSSVHAVGSERTPFVTRDKLAPFAWNTKPFSRGGKYSHADAWARLGYSAALVEDARQAVDTAGEADDQPEESHVLGDVAATGYEELIPVLQIGVFQGATGSDRLLHRLSLQDSGAAALDPQVLHFRVPYGAARRHERVREGDVRGNEVIAGLGHRALHRDTQQRTGAHRRVLEILAQLLAEVILQLRAQHAAQGNRRAAPDRQYDIPLAPHSKRVHTSLQ